MKLTLLDPKSKMATRIEQLEQGRYPGGKNAAGTYQKLIDLFPTHWQYAECFAGSAGLFRRKTPARQSYLIDRDPAVVNFWKNAAPSGTIVERNFACSWLASHASVFTRDWFIYLDPPYPMETRTKKKIYGQFEMSHSEHAGLLGIIRGLDANIMISSYDSKLYCDALHDWWHTSFPVVTRGGTMRDEHVWCNYTPGQHPELSRPFAGDGFRERERIKRKVARHVANFQKLPPHERQCLISALIQANSNG